MVPILDLLYKAFSNESVVLVGMAYTVAGFAFIPSSLFTPYLLRHFKIKNIMLTGTLLCMLGGGLGGLFKNIYFIIGMHGIEGAGAGLCANIIPIYIAKLCKSEDDILKMDSMNGAVGTGFGMISSVLSGQLAARFGWQSSYLVFFLAGAILVLQLFFLPDTVSQADDKGSEQAFGRALTPQIFKWLLEVFLFSLFINVMWTNQAGFLSENSLGGADTAGLASACIAGGGFFSAFAITYMIKKAKSYYQNVCYLLFIIALSVMLAGKSAGVFCFASFIWGLGQGLIYPYLWANATLISPNEAAISKVVSWTTVGWYLGVGMTTIVYRPIASIFNNESCTFAMEATRVFFVIFFIYRMVMGTMEAGKAGLKHAD